MHRYIPQYGITFFMKFHNQNSFNGTISRIFGNGISTEGYKISGEIEDVLKF